MFLGRNNPFPIDTEYRRLSRTTLNFSRAIFDDQVNAARKNMVTPFGGRNVLGDFHWKSPQDFCDTWIPGEITRTIDNFPIENLSGSSSWFLYKGMYVWMWLLFRTFLSAALTPDATPIAQDASSLSIFCAADLYILFFWIWFVLLWINW